MTEREHQVRRLLNDLREHEPLQFAEVVRWATTKAGLRALTASSHHMILDDDLARAALTALGWWCGSELSPDADSAWYERMVALGLGPTQQATAAHARMLLRVEAALRGEEVTADAD